MPRWLTRRKAIKELRAIDDELRQEYMKMREQDRQMQEDLPPSYQEAQESSGESLAAIGMDRSRRGSEMSNYSSTGSVQSQSG
jgi:hypothetical protein